MLTDLDGHRNMLNLYIQFYGFEDMYVVTKIISFDSIDVIIFLFYIKININHKKSSICILNFMDLKKS